MEENENFLDAAANFAGETANEARAIFRLDELSKYLTWQNAFRVMASVLAILIFYIAYRIIRSLVKRAAQKKFQAKTALALTKAVSYTFYILLLMYILNLFGVKLTAIWGAAGVAGIAIGFAAQTSVSNLISGIFVLTDKALKIGDFIEIDGNSGTVERVGFLAIKIKTPDGQALRIPNSSVMSANLKNYSANPTRRFVFALDLDYEIDMEKALKIFQEVPKKCSAVLSEPAPKIFYDGFGDSGIVMKIAVWMNASDLITVKNQMYVAIKNMCDEQKIKIPYSRLDVSIVEK